MRVLYLVLFGFSAFVLDVVAGAPRLGVRSLLDRDVAGHPLFQHQVNPYRHAGYDQNQVDNQVQLPSDRVVPRYKTFRYQDEDTDQSENDSDYEYTDEDYNEYVNDDEDEYEDDGEQEDYTGEDQDAYEDDRRDQGGNQERGRYKVKQSEQYQGRDRNDVEYVQDERGHYRNGDQDAIEYKVDDQSLQRRYNNQGFVDPRRRDGSFYDRRRIENFDGQN